MIITEQSNTTSRLFRMIQNSSISELIWQSYTSSSRPMMIAEEFLLKPWKHLRTSNKISIPRQGMWIRLCCSPRSTWRKICKGLTGSLKKILMPNKPWLRQAGRRLKSSTCAGRCQMTDSMKREKRQLRSHISLESTMKKETATTTTPSLASTIA